MSSEKIIIHCAPTLVGIKTANLFNEYFSDKKKLLEEIRTFNQTFSKSGITMFCLAIKDNRALIYVCRMNDLKADLANHLNKDILSRYGYDSDDIYRSLLRLGSRIEGPNGFPHEIGCFLGYPPEDVKGFIDNKGQNYKSLGYWKVYGDPIKAKQTFEDYRICQQALLDKLNKGYTLKQLIIHK